MKNEYQKSLGCSLAITSSSFSVYIWVQRLSQTSFYTWLTFSKTSQVSPGDPYLNLALFAIALQESLSVHFVCFKIWKLQIVDTSSFLKTLCVELEVSTSKTQKTEFYQAQGANFVTFLSNLGLFKAKSRSNLSVMNN